MAYGWFGSLIKRKGGGVAGWYNVPGGALMKDAFPREILHLRAEDSANLFNEIDRLLLGGTGARGAPSVIHSTAMPWCA